MLAKNNAAIAASIKTTNVESLQSISDIIGHYKAIGIKLSLFADVVPESAENQKQLIEQETALLDEQAALLDMALLQPVASLEDATSILTLWHEEVFQTQSVNSLSAADELVNSVYEFLKLNAAKG